MSNMVYATIGTVSHATLRTDDLLDAFATELEYHVQRNALAWSDESGRRLRDNHMELIGRAREYKGEGEDGSELFSEGEGATELISELIDALNEFAAPYCYFGTLEGDGADFGFWPSHDAISELPKIADPSELDSIDEGDVAYVNDHGNVTVYDAATGKAILEIV